MQDLFINTSMMCVLLERRIKEDNAPAENRKRSAKVARQVFKSTQGNKKDRTCRKEQVITTEVLSPLELFFDILVYNKNCRTWFFMISITSNVSVSIVVLSLWLQLIMLTLPLIILDIMKNLLYI